MRKRRTCLVLLAAVAARHAALSQPAASPPADDALPSVAEQIEEIQSKQGINSPDLLSPLTNLGLILREQGDDDLAIAAFERARHVVRVNYGLSSFKEAPLLRQLVQIEEGRGNAAAAWDLEQELIGFIRHSPGPRPGEASMLREIADKRVDVLERYAAGEFPPQIELGCYYGGPRVATAEKIPGSCRSGTSSSVKQALYEEAASYYYDVMDMIRFAEGASSDELPELYMAVLRASYAARNDYGTEGQGRAMLRSLHERHVKYSAPLPVQMNALLQMADWDLLFAGGRNEKEAAFQAYETLYAQLRQEGMEQSFVDGIFSPSLPVVLPAFSPNPLVSAETPGSRGFIDVAFEITKYGKGTSIEVLDTTTNRTDAARLRLVGLIQRSRFRPRMTDGAFEDSARVVVRYYVND
ncbi:MAG TPA: tetratricopeptide repeat protein [Gammaproteobacteria bacterium]